MKQIASQTYSRQGLLWHALAVSMRFSLVPGRFFRNPAMPITAVYYRPRAEMLSMPVPSQQESQSSGTSSASSQNDEIHPASMCCAHPTTSSLPQLKEIVRAIRSIRTISKEQVRSEPLKDLIKMLDQVEKMMTVERTQLTASGLDAIKKLGAYISDHRLINPNKQGHSLDGLGDPPGLAEELRKLIDSCGAFQKEADSSGSPSPLPSSPSSDTPLSRLEMVMQSFRNLLTNASCNHYARHASNALHLMLRTIICVGMSTFIREAIGYLIEKNIRDDKNKEGETTKRIIFATCAVTTPILMQLAVLLRSNRNGSATYSTEIVH
ncbi:hypothetical protein RGU70_08610 [Herbaspirillum sp. RTI4]|uniref:hypothetical protein n=1 Tax=Herbaspirillum sp. RTI4 TaxID=3048640 RepID=UPI002AB49CCE|nr:hypothetical protein [Herbaspirillum sp. RTI4]MDY7578382.1 hypothetical protein [Herbaspirillum sp. RTI4]MEA9983077.1 hypothetical protein [Herbaspirillum sp. RTI4]